MSPLSHLSKETLFLIDGSGFIFRAYHALPPLTRSDGTPVGAVLGFTNMLVKILTEMDAHYLAVVFDAGRHTFRNDIYPAYKANRRETPEDLIPQFPLIREVCLAFGVPMIEREGFEADDLIASYAAQEKERPVMIVSSDKDLMQLVSDRVQLFDPIKNKVIDRAAVYEKFGVEPEQVIAVQALAGDSSDNIPGVPGIGLKTASTLIQEFKSLHNLLTHAHTIKQEKRREALIAFSEQAYLSEKLVTLDKQISNLVSVESFKMGSPNIKTLLPFLEEQGFKTLKKRLMPLEEERVECSRSSIYELVLTYRQLSKWIQWVKEAGFVAVDTETTSLNAKEAQLVGISLAVSGHGACYIPILFNPEVSLLDPNATQLEMTKDTILKTIAPLMMDQKIIKIGHNLKYDKLVLKQCGVNIVEYEDTMLLSYLMKGGRHGLDYLTELHFHHQMLSFKEVTGTGKKAVTFDQVPLDKALDYAASDADYTHQLYELLKPQLTPPALQMLYNTIDLPLVDMLVDMEDMGVRIDPTILRSLAHDLDKRLTILEHDIYHAVNTEFNIGSPKQLGEILFETLKLPGGKKGKTGAYMTGSDILEDLMETHPSIEKILEWRQLSKLKSTYTTALVEQINPKTGRLHTSYAMAVTSTGRLASSDPNLQNIPVRTEEGRKIRKAFVAPQGSFLVSFDYSQIELRLLAHMADIEPLQKAFINNQDIHILTASQVFGVPLEQVPQDLRSKAKAINFGIIYGISAFGLAKQLRIDRSEAAFYIQAYHQQYPGIKAYMEKTIEFARIHGYVETLWGRRCYVPEINSKNPTLRSFSERQAINAPLQGSNADLIKKSMIKAHAFLRNHQSKLLLQVHDELIFEVPENELIILKESVKKIMESVEHLKVPLIVGVGCGKTWEDAH